MAVLFSPVLFLAWVWGLVCAVVIWLRRVVTLVMSTVIAWVALAPSAAAFKKRQEVAKKWGTKLILDIQLYRTPFRDRYGAVACACVCVVQAAYWIGDGVSSCSVLLCSWAIVGICCWTAHAGTSKPGAFAVKRTSTCCSSPSWCVRLRPLPRTVRLMGMRARRQIWNVDAGLGRGLTYVVCFGILFGNYVKDLYLYVHAAPREPGVPAVLICFDALGVVVDVVLFWRVPSHGLCFVFHRVPRPPSPPVWIPKSAHSTDSTALRDYGFPSTHSVNGVTNPTFFILCVSARVNIISRPAPAVLLLLHLWAPFAVSAIRQIPRSHMILWHSCRVPGTTGGQGTSP